MDPKVAYWTAALVNMALVVGLATRGITLVRRGEVASHRRHMVAAVALVVGFVLSYVGKLAFLGREQLELWDALSIQVLRFHETCVLVMVVAGGLAFHRGARLRRTRLVTRAPEDPAPAPALVRFHRRAGTVALWASVLGVVSAGVVLGGMYARGGWLQ